MNKQMQYTQRDTSCSERDDQEYDRIETGESSPSIFKMSPKRQPKSPNFRFNLRVRILLVAAVFLAAIVLGLHFGIPYKGDSDPSLQDQSSPPPYDDDQNIITMIDTWLEGEGLNAYGDDLDTVYDNGPPSFDTSNGEADDRVEYLQDKFANSPWENAETENNFDLQKDELKNIDTWLKENSLNQYGDPYGTVYTGASPLFDEDTKKVGSRLDFLKSKFPDSPWAEMPEKKMIDTWLEMKGLNEFGDPKDTVYAGGDPLFDMTTGESMDRDDYLKAKFPDSPWEI